MPFKSDKQRRYLFSQKPEVAKKIARHMQEGGPLVATGTPAGGNAAAAIGDYLSGAPLAGGISYGANQAAAGQQERIDEARNLQSLAEEGIIDTSSIAPIIQQQREERDTHWEDIERANYNPQLFGSLANYTPVGIPGSDKIPSVTGGLLSGIGEAQVNHQKAQLEKYGPSGAMTFRSPSGFPVTVHRGLGGNLVLTGNTEGIPASAYFKAAQKAGVTTAKQAKTKSEAESKAERAKAWVQQDAAANQAAYEEAAYGGPNYGGGNTGFTKSESGRHGSGTGGQARSGEFVSNDHDWSRAYQGGGFVNRMKPKEMPLKQRQAVLAEAIKNDPSLLQQLGPLALEAGIGYATGDPLKMSAVAARAAPAFFSKGGEVSGPLASTKYKMNGGKVTHEWERKYHNTKDNTHKPSASGGE